MPSLHPLLHLSKHTHDYQVFALRIGAYWNSNLGLTALKPSKNLCFDSNVMARLTHKDSRTPEMIMPASPSRYAMSMVEVMMAMVVLTVALMAVFGAIGSTQKANEMSRTRNLVMGEFEKAIEGIQASAAIYSTSASTPYVTSSASSFDVASGSVKGLAATTNSTSLVTVRPKTTLSTPTGLIPLTVTVNYYLNGNNLSETRDYYYAPRP